MLISQYQSILKKLDFLYLREQTAIAVNIFYFGELINSKHFHRTAHFIFFDLHCQVLSGEVELDKTELSAYQWIKPEDALK